MTDFLVEIGTEELPPKALARLAHAFADGIAAGLSQARLGSGSAQPYFSPRRLAVHVADVPSQQPDAQQRRLGPAVKAAFDADGKPTKAALGFAASCGVDVAGLEQEGGRLATTVTEAGQPATTLLPDIVRDALARLPTPKRMRWGSGSAEFVRPVHWVVMLYGDEVVDTEIFGIHSGRHTRGHRFHAPEPLALPSAKDYPAAMRSVWVAVNDADNSLGAQLREQVRAAASALGGKALGLDSDLPEEVAALVEWPVPVIGSFAEKYLALPREVLVTTLMHHQRYFPLQESEAVCSPLLPAFITFANIDSKEPVVVQNGNERVVVPRLDDAMFFWEQDRGTPLAARAPALDSIAWQKNMGSVGDKVRRVEALAVAIGTALGADETVVRRVSGLAKCDLLSAMVGEFPELQGVMGRHYALNDGEPESVATAIEEHYLPRFAGDETPASAAGQTVALADRIDTLAAVFATGARPTGDKDPFALRRAVLGVLRIIIERDLDVDLSRLFSAAVVQLPGAGRDPALVDALIAFTLDRLRALELERGTPPDVFEAVAVLGLSRPLDFVARLRAVAAFQSLPAADSLAAANKRIANILKQASGSQAGVDPALFVEAAEKSLWQELSAAEGEVAPLFDAGDYTAGLTRLAGLRASIDSFFDTVMVMADDAAVRANRIALLGSVLALFRKVADIGALQK